MGKVTLIHPLCTMQFFIMPTCRTLHSTASDQCIASRKSMICFIMECYQYRPRNNPVAVCPVLLLWCPFQSSNYKLKLSSYMQKCPLLERRCCGPSREKLGPVHVTIYLLGFTIHTNNLSYNKKFMYEQTSMKFHLQEGRAIFILQMAKGSFIRKSWKTVRRGTEAKTRATVASVEPS